MPDIFKVQKVQMSVSDALLPDLEATVERIAATPGVAPATAFQTTTSTVVVGNDEYSFVGVFTKTS